MFSGGDVQSADYQRNLWYGDLQPGFRFDVQCRYNDGFLLQFSGRRFLQLHSDGSGYSAADNYLSDQSNGSLGKRQSDSGGVSGSDRWRQLSWLDCRLLACFWFKLPGRRHYGHLHRD